MPLKDGSTGTWNNLVAPPLVLDDFADAPVVNNWNDVSIRTGHRQHGPGSRTNSRKLAGRAVKTAKRACDQLANLMERGPIPKWVARAVAESASRLDGLAQSALGASESDNGGGNAW